ncbi:hypothetical protein L1049_023427 [Liquidambar formosana]|uniref:F-box domain-containing protein n=1 Tax=Liquidambar formosana TaxID=63359 RepID=A0AAP0X3G8_LIQFO
MSGYFPPEIFDEILLTLSLKTLLRCTCVCKLWNFLITDPIFITTHLNRTTVSANTNNDLLLLRQYFGKHEGERYSLRRDNPTLDEFAELEFPFQATGSGPHGKASSELFGFDAKSNDYKVVRLVYPDCTKGSVVEVYSLSTGVWRGIRAGASALWDHFRCHGKGEGKGKFSIWVMKQYGVAESWSKQFIIDSQGRWSTPLGLSKSGEILLATSNEEVVSYHPETQQVMDVAIRGSEVLFYLGNYVESLVLVSGVLRREEESCGEESKNGGLE